ncbi:hypothetical protein SAMN05444377_10479 [Flavobacterium fontis]|uniref:Uncharacterized protein n=1 Tax=Flavobacterium fontis TaxID=1124188 RepID=A0A1M4Z8T5_9FLAO|nr:hypothetical protein [Flavobacterium fontis]SHF13838.1 hypothetical protein SAMN05444377_10467 [Flavobacterium fontis]SHF14217.1 hypothetical protein SAMN05444377_10479 [Flavobacterium fontis]
MINQNFFDIPLNQGLIDSLTVFLPLDKITIIDNRLTDEYMCYYPDNNDSGLLIEELHPPKPIMINHNGINFRMNKVVLSELKDKRGNILREHSEAIRLTLTAKMLHGEYFRGINNDNISRIVDYINTTNIIKIDTETILNSPCNDIDICINYRLDFDIFKESRKFLYNLVKDSKKHAVELFPAKETQKINKNIGLIYGDREKGLISTPFCKFYNKENELLTKSAEFYNIYLFPQLKYGLSIKNLIRKEITLRNNEQKKNLIKNGQVNKDNPLKTLKNILDITQDQLTEICNSTLRYYYDKKQFSIPDDLKPLEKILAGYMQQIINLGGDKLALIAPLDSISCKVTKSRTKAKIDELIKIVFSDDYIKKQAQKNEFMNDFLKLQSIW